MSSIQVADKPTLDKIKNAIIDSNSGDNKIDECLTKLDEVINGAGSGGSFVKLADVTNVSVTAGADAISALYNDIKWKDPDDVVISGTSGAGTFAEWAGTIVVRKKNGIPSSISDGIVVVNNKVRNQYQTTGFKDDTDLEELTTYYYRFFPYSTSNVTREGQYVNVTTIYEYVSWSTSSDTSVYNALQRHNNGLIDLYDDYGWREGDVRPITIPAQSSFTYTNPYNGNTETVEAQPELTTGLEIVKIYDKNTSFTDDFGSHTRDVRTFLIGFRDNFANRVKITDYKSQYKSACVRYYASSRTHPIGYGFGYASYNSGYSETADENLAKAKHLYLIGGGYYTSHIKKMLDNLYNNIIPSWIKNSIFKVQRPTQKITTTDSTYSLNDNLTFITENEDTALFLPQASLLMNINKRDPISTIYGTFGVNYLKKKLSI